MFCALDHSATTAIDICWYIKQILLLISSVFYYYNGFIKHIDLKMQQKSGSRFKLFLITLQFQGVTNGIQMYK